MSGPINPYPSSLETSISPLVSFGLGVAFVGQRIAILLIVIGIGMLVLFVMYANLVNSLAGAMQSLRN